jgi:hypothetical protein
LREYRRYPILSLIRHLEGTPLATTACSFASWYSFLNLLSAHLTSPLTCQHKSLGVNFKAAACRKDCSCGYQIPREKGKKERRECQYRYAGVKKRFRIRICLYKKTYSYPDASYKHDRHSNRKLSDCMRTTLRSISFIVSRSHVDQQQYLQFFRCQLHLLLSTDPQNTNILTHMNSVYDKPYDSYKTQGYQVLGRHHILEVQCTYSSPLIGCAGVGRGIPLETSCTAGVGC